MTRRPTPFPALCLILGLAPLASAAADTPVPLPLTYQIFEAAVPHQDLALCPPPLAAPGVFCRVTVVHDGLNVFAFSEQGDQPLVGFRSWPADLLEGLMD